MLKLKEQPAPEIHETDILACLATVIVLKIDLGVLHNSGVA